MILAAILGFRGASFRRGARCAAIRSAQRPILPRRGDSQSPGPPGAPTLTERPRWLKAQPGRRLTTRIGARRESGMGNGELTDSRLPPQDAPTTDHGPRTTDHRTTNP